MSRLKKTVIAILLISPIILAFFFGYPVSTYREEVKGGFTYTKRCFKVGELGQFLRCYRGGKVVKQGGLIRDLNGKASALFPFFNAAFFVAVALSCLLLFFL